MEYIVKFITSQLYIYIFNHRNNKQFSAENFPAIFDTHALPLASTYTYIRSTCTYRILTGIKNIFAL